MHTMFTDLFTAFTDASPLALVATVSLLAFVALSALDGVWIHLVRLRLHARPESRREHLFHTARALLFVPILLTVFTADTTSTVFWLGVGFVAADQAAELLDMWSERDSRATLGGLSSGEYTLHVALTTVRTAALALAFAARAPHVGALSPEPGLALFDTIGALLVPGAIVVGALHVALVLPCLHGLQTRLGLRGAA